MRTTVLNHQDLFTVVFELNVLILLKESRTQAFHARHFRVFESQSFLGSAQKHLQRLAFISMLDTPMYNRFWIYIPRNTQGIWIRIMRLYGRCSVYVFVVVCIGFESFLSFRIFSFFIIYSFVFPFHTFFFSFYLLSNTIIIPLFLFNFHFHKWFHSTLIQ